LRTFERVPLQATATQTSPCFFPFSSPIATQREGGKGGGKGGGRGEKKTKGNVNKQDSGGTTWLAISSSLTFLFRKGKEEKKKGGKEGKGKKKGRGKGLQSSAALCPSRSLSEAVRCRRRERGRKKEGRGGKPEEGHVTHKPDGR